MYIPYIETHGKPFHNYARVLEQEAANQMSAVMASPWVMRGALMPDAHLGYTMPIGGVAGCKDMVCPAFVGYDIGCGMLAQKINMDPKILEQNKYEIRDEILKVVPVGFKHQRYNQEWEEYANIPKTDWFNEKFHEFGGLKQLGTLGGGNHFIELGLDEEFNVWLVIHSGSRNVGHKTAGYYMSIAHPENRPKEGVHGLSVDSIEGKNYIKDLNVCLEFALENRKNMSRKIFATIKGFDPKVEYEDWFINRNHNHAEYNKELDLWIHRKGATHAEKDMLGVIPGNMVHGSYIVRGKGNIDSLFSSSHGAGRVLGRKAAIKALDLKEMVTQLDENGIAATSYREKDLQEAPGAYKSPEEVIELQSDLIEVLHRVKPVVNIKG